MADSTGSSGAAGTSSTASSAATVTTTASVTTAIGDSSSDSGFWPLCEPREFDTIRFSVEGLDEWPDGAHIASCLLGAVDGNGIELTDCTDDAGIEVRTSLNLSLDLTEDVVLPVSPADAVEVSYVVSRDSKLNTQQRYSLRTPDGALILAAFATYDEVVADDDPDWASPFVVSRGPFICPVEGGGGCESDDNPQRAVATVEYNGSSLDIIDGSTALIDGFRVWLEAGEPDYCEGQPTSHKLYGVFIRGS